MRINELEKIKKFFIELKNILNNYGDSSIKNQTKIVNYILEVFECELSDDKKFIEIKRHYGNLFPAKGGLSDFYIWKDDYEERKKANEPLDDIRKQLWKILK